MTGAAEVRTTPRRRAWRSPLAWVTLLGVVGVGLLLDLGSKRLAFERVADAPVIIHRGNTSIPFHAPVTAIPKVLNLHLVKNEGAVFGIGASQRVFFIFFTFGALAAAFAVFGRWTTARDHAAHIAIGLILAGGLGNLYDRLTFSVVRDFLHLFPGIKLPFGLKWWGGSDEIFPWVFNLADVMLLTGMGLLMLHINRLENKRKVAAATGATAPATAGGNPPPPSGHGRLEAPQRVG